MGACKGLLRALVPALVVAGLGMAIGGTTVVSDSGTPTRSNAALVVNCPDPPNCTAGNHNQVLL